MRPMFPHPTHSLDPAHRATTDLKTLEGKLTFSDPQLHDAWLQAMKRIQDACFEHFPETIFWDFEFLGASLLVEFPDAEELLARSEQIAGLQMSYGIHSKIRFRYVHDFIYGFDWAKWIGRDPDARREHGPFSGAFLDHVERRGSELILLIEEDDETYPKLPSGEPRNPFVFSRDPEQERDLFRTLAKRELIPVEAWRTNAVPHWDRPYADLRVEVARELGIQK